MIFDEPTLHKLRQLTLTSSQVRAGMLKGERRSTKRGASIEFADYRNYSSGDDLRRLDWNVYARLERPFIKLLEEEEDLAVHILLDTSRSMDWGEGEQHKLTYAIRLSAALGVIALSKGDRLTISALNNGKVVRVFNPARGAQQIPRLLNFLENLSGSGYTDLVESLRRYGLESQRPGLAFLISDMLSPTGHLEGLKQMQGQGYELTLLHLLAPDELDPPLAGDLRLVDIETGKAQDVSLDAGLRDLYRQTLQRWQQDIQSECWKRGVKYLQLSTAEPWDKVVLYEMRKVHMVK